MKVEKVRAGEDWQECVALYSQSALSTGAFSSFFSVCQSPPAEGLPQL